MTSLAPDPPPEDIIANLARTYHEFKTDFELWHPRLAHINSRLALSAKPDLKDWPKKLNCDDCFVGKFHKHSHSGRRPTAAEMNWLSGEYITCDLVGPLLRSRGGSYYAPIYTDLASRFIWIKVLTSKSDNYQAMQEVFQDAKARSRNSIRFFKTDGDGIFTGEEAKRIYAKHSLRHIQSAPGDSASNDIAERSIRTVMELTRTNLLHAGAPPFGRSVCVWLRTYGIQSLYVQILSTLAQCCPILRCLRDTNVNMTFRIYVHLAPSASGCSLSRRKGARS